MSNSRWRNVGWLLDSELEKLEQAFLAKPSSGETFALLQKKYQDAADLANLTRIYERHAAYLGDRRKAADLLVKAAEIHRQLENQAAEIGNLTKALDFDPSQIKANSRLKELYQHCLVYH